MNNKVRGNKNAICLHFLPYLLNVCRKYDFFISQGGVATCLSCGGQFRIVFSKFICAFQQCKNFENRLRFDKVSESLKVGTFLRHSVVFFATKCSETTKVITRIVVNLVLFLDFIFYLKQTNDGLWQPQATGIKTTTRDIIHNYTPRHSHS